MEDLISRQVAENKLTELVAELEGIFSDIRERLVDDSVCGLCEYDCDHGIDGSANECPGYERDDCFKLRAETRKEWTDTSDIPSAVPCKDAISRQAVLSGLASIAKVKAKSDAQKALMGRVMFFVEQLPSVTPIVHESEKDADCISRQAAIEVVEKWFNKIQLNGDICCDGIRSLPSVTPSGDKKEAVDCIDRGSAIIQLSHNKIGDDDCDLVIQRDIETIKMLPSVTPARSKGKWKNTRPSYMSDSIVCSQCGYDSIADYSFCPNCGADMRGDNNE